MSFFFWQVEGWHGGSRAMLQIPHGWEFPGDPGCGRGGCWEVRCPSTNPGTRTLPESHAHTCGRWWVTVVKFFTHLPTFGSVIDSPHRLNAALVSVCVFCVGLLSDSESSDRGESGVVAGPGLSATREQTSPSLHIPRGPSSTHPVALASLPIQRPVSSPED